MEVSMPNSSLISLLTLDQSDCYLNLREFSAPFIWIKYWQ